MRWREIVVIRGDSATRGPIRDSTKGFDRKYLRAGGLRFGLEGRTAIYVIGCGLGAAPWGGEYML